MIRALLVLLVLCCGLRAQETPQVQEPSPTLRAADVDPVVLEHGVVPLTAEELTGLATHWRERLADVAGRVADRQVVVERGGEGAAAAREELQRLRRERDRTLERFDIVLGALADKGGETGELEAYRDAVAGRVDLTNWEALVDGAKDWLTRADGGVRWGLNLIQALVALLVFKVLASLLAGLVGRALGTFKRGSDLLRTFFVNIVRKVVFFIGIVIALAFLEIPTGPFLAVIGAAGFILGFALQGTLDNFACGIMILMYRPFDIGDFVDVAGLRGTVKAMTLVSTTLATPDNQVVIVPNNKIWGDVITNVTGSTTRRVDMTFGISYRDDIGKAVEVLHEVVGAHELTLEDPAPAVMVGGLGDSSVNILCRPWVETPDYWPVYWDLQRKVKEAFDRNGVSIPFPQRDVHLYREMPSGDPQQAG